MSKIFNLSDKLQWGQDGNQDFIIKSKIKEFIKLLKKDLFFEIDGQFYIRPANKITDIINKLAGEDLI